MTVTKQYFMIEGVGQLADWPEPLHIGPDKFAALVYDAPSYAVALLVDGNNAMAVRRATLGGPAVISATAKMPGRPADAEGLLPAVARLMLPFGRSGRWLTLAEAHAAAHPGAAPQPEATIAATFRKGRAALDAKSGRGNWAAFEQDAGFGDGPVRHRFQPGWAAAASNSDAPPVRWLVAWDEDGGGAQSDCPAVATMAPQEPPSALADQRHANRTLVVVARESLDDIAEGRRLAAWRDWRDRCVQRERRRRSAAAFEAGASAPGGAGPADSVPLPAVPRGPPRVLLQLPPRLLLTPDIVIPSIPYTKPPFLSVLGVYARLLDACYDRAGCEMVIAVELSCFVMEFPTAADVAVGVAGLQADGKTVDLRRASFVPGSLPGPRLCWPGAPLIRAEGTTTNLRTGGKAFRATFTVKIPDGFGGAAEGLFVCLAVVVGASVTAKSQVDHFDAVPRVV